MIVQREVIISIDDRYGRQARTLAFRCEIIIGFTLPRNRATYRLVKQALEHYQNKNPHLRGHLNSI